MSKELLNTPGTDFSARAPNLPSVITIAALQLVPDSVFLFDSQRRLVFANPKAEQLHPSSSLVPGTKCCQMFWSTENGTCVVDRALDNNRKLEFEMFSRDAKEIPLLVTVQALKCDNTGESVGVLVVARDISALRRAEAEAIAQKSFMANVADRSPDEIYALDRQGRITWVNQRAEADHSVLYLGQRLFDFVAQDFRETVNAALVKALSGEDTQAEIRTLALDETTRDVEANTSPLWKDGDVDGVLVFLRDITDRKRTQELVSQSDKLRAAGELAAGVAHKLNNS